MTAQEKLERIRRISNDVREGYNENGYFCGGFDLFVTDGFFTESRSGFGKNPEQAIDNYWHLLVSLLSSGMLVKQGKLMGHGERRYFKWSQEKDDWEEIADLNNYWLRWGRSEAFWEYQLNIALLQAISRES
ncbi:MAG TPA: hypothetical protein VJA27_03685 [Patescibacteria group bacterium]|nr:hypothetical protein [Patescibacteria group bacterium]